jgi:hypothetical protein
MNIAYFSTLRRSIVAALAVAASFALYAQAPAGLATIADTADGGGPGGAAFFMVTAIEGVEVSETALAASMRASFGRGAYMVTRSAERTAPAGKVTLKLRGVQTHVAPIDTIFRAIFKGGNPEVTGTVTVELVGGQRYRANGVLDSFKREVWLEDERGVELPGSKVTASPDPEILKAMEGAVFVATNLRYEGDWISEASSPQLSFVPVGARLKVTELGSNRASILIDGRKMRMGVDFSRGYETIQQFIDRATTSQDPRPKLTGFPEKIRNAIRSGRVVAGMTREQVLLSLGRPRVDFNPKLDVQEWKYQVPEQEELFLLFDEAGLLKEIDGSRKARKLVLYESQ